MTSVKTMTESMSDAAVRERIGPWAPDGLADLSRFEAETNFVVRAAAGSGKTTSLVARMVALVRRGVPVRQLAAITFTRKAAGEMNERFFKELRKVRAALAERDDRPRELEHVERALRDLQHGFIGTVHSFCGRILREHPLAVDLPPDFATGIDERDERRLRREALSSYLGLVYRDDPERLELLAEAGVELEEMPSFFDTLCGFPDLELYTDGAEGPPALQEAVEKASALMRRWQMTRPAELPKGRDEVMKAFDRAERMLEGGLESAGERAAFLEEFASVSSEEKAKVTLNRWGSTKEAKDVAKTLRDQELPALIREHVAPVLSRWHAYVHRLVVETLEPAVEHYRDLRRERGDLTHHDLLFFARELLRDNPDVRRQVQERYRRLLVDEFQDTDPLQAEILFYLTSQDVSERDWRRCRPRPGSLFIVGDDKQSIYRFRRADKAVFDDVARLVGESGGHVVDLTRNFRSFQSILDWCNDCFAGLFAEERLADLQAEYVPFSAHRPLGEDAHGIRTITIGDKKGNRGAEIAGEDAGQIARFIRGVVDGLRPELEEGDDAVFPKGASFGDFLILTRTKTRLKVYAETLARYDIPYTITGSEDLGESPEMRALVDLLVAAARPDDAVAAVAYLKGGLCGWSDDDLYAFRQAGGRFDAMDQMPSGEVLGELHSPLREQVETDFGRLLEARAMLHTTRPARAIEWIVRDNGLLEGAAHPDDPREASLRAGRVLRLMTYARSLANDGLEWTEVLEELLRVVEGEEKVDGMTLETGSEEAVRIMNVHQSKGLEAPVVFLADPYSSGSGGKTTLHVRREENELVAPVVTGEGYYTSIKQAPARWHTEFEAEEERHEEAEARRLLYVAATRAKNLLVVSRYPKKADAGYWSDLYAALDEAEVPELQVPEVEERVPTSAPAPDLEATEQRLETARQHAGAATFTETSVTDEKEAVRERFSESGYGSLFGTVVHELLELLVRRGATPETLQNAPVEALFEARARTDESEEDEQPASEQDEQPAFTPEDVERARVMARRWLESDLAERVRRAEVVRAEHELLAASSDEVVVIERGTIDLLFRDAGGWHIVDFKTDKVDDAAMLDSLSRDHPYMQQVQRYAEVWQELTGAPVASASLWFADEDRYVEVV